MMTVFQKHYLSLPAPFFPLGLSSFPLLEEVKLEEKESKIK